MSRTFLLFLHFFNNLTYRRRLFWRFSTKDLCGFDQTVEKNTVFLPQNVGREPAAILDRRNSIGYNYIDADCALYRKVSERK